MEDFLYDIENKVSTGIGIQSYEALKILESSSDDLFTIISLADKVRRKFKGDKVRLCSIINAQSGLCSEDCAFCAQSKISNSDIKKYPMMDSDEIALNAAASVKSGANEFSIVMSGYGLKNKNDIKKVGLAIENIKDNTGLETCISAGIIDKETIGYLKNKGLDHIHHNLETSKNFFPNICTTHSYEEDVEVVKIAKSAGMRVCSGGIFGIGESDKDRVELAYLLKKLDVDSIPINFLSPVKGTPLEESANLTPIVCLKIIAMMRLVNPTKDIIVCGGREINLDDLQSLIFAAGANGMIIGNYLTTSGRDISKDMQMIKDLNLEPVNGYLS